MPLFSSSLCRGDSIVWCAYETWDHQCVFPSSTIVKLHKTLFSKKRCFSDLLFQIFLLLHSKWSLSHSLHLVIIFSYPVFSSESCIIFPSLPSGNVYFLGGNVIHNGLAFSVPTTHLTISLGHRTFFWSQWELCSQMKYVAGRETFPTFLSLADSFFVCNNVFHSSVDKNLFVNFLYLTPTLNAVKQHQPFSPHPPRLKVSQRQLGYSSRNCHATNW